MFGHIMGDDTVRNFGVVIAICGALFVFGGQTFAIWTLGLEDKTADEETTLKFGADQIDVEFSGSDAPDDFSAEYGDDECMPGGCDETEDFFATLKLMFFALIGCGVAIAYFGNSGDLENLPAVAGITAILSIAIMAYTFISLPEAWEEDTEFFETLDEDPTLFVNKERDDEGGDIHLKAMPHIGFFLPVVSLTLGGLLVKPEWMD